MSRVNFETDRCSRCGKELQGFAWRHSGNGEEREELLCQECGSDRYYRRKVRLPSRCPCCGAILRVRAPSGFSSETLALCRKYYRLFGFHKVDDFVDKIHSFQPSPGMIVNVKVDGKELPFAPAFMLSEYDGLGYRRGITVEKEFFITPYWSDVKHLFSLHEVPDDALIPLSKTREFLSDHGIFPLCLPSGHRYWDQPIPLRNFLNLMKRWESRHSFLYDEADPHKAMAEIVLHYLVPSLGTMFKSDENLLEALYRKEDLLRFTLRELINWETRIDLSTRWNSGLWGLPERVGNAVYSYISQFDLLHTDLPSSPIFDATLRFCVSAQVLAQERASELLNRVAQALGFEKTKDGSFVKSSLVIGRNAEVFIDGQRYCIVPRNPEKGLPRADMVATMMFTLANPDARRKISTLGEPERRLLAKLFPSDLLNEAYKVFGERR